MSKKKVYIVGAGSMEQQDKLKEIIETDCIYDVIVSDTKPKEMEKTRDENVGLAAAMMLGMTAKMTKYGKSQGNNKTPKKKKRSKNKKTHRG